MTRGWLLAACLLAISGRPAAGQEPPVLTGRTVVSQQVTAAGSPVHEPGILDLIETRPGASLDPALVRETIAHLVGLGRYEDVVVHAEAIDGGGVAVRYDLVPLRTIERLEFQGDVGVSERVLRDQVAERVDEAPTFARIPDILRVIEQVYRDNGYLQPAVAPRLQSGAGADPSTLLLEVAAGPRVQYAEVVVEGNAPMPLPQVAAGLGFDRGDFYRRPDVEARLDALVEDLRDRGYYEARATHTLTPSADFLTATLEIDVDAGPHVTIVFEGDTLSERVRRELVPIEREGSLDEDLLEDSALRIEAHLREEGYRDADAEYARMPRNGELAVVFRVTRGPQYRTASVTVAGNDSIPDAELQPLLRTAAGQLLVDDVTGADAARLAEYYRRRGFTEVAVDPTVIPTAGGGDPVPIEVRFDVTEGVRTLVGDIALQGGSTIPAATLRTVISSTPGQPYYQPQVAVDRDGLLLQYLNRGYQNAIVDAVVTFSPDRRTADIRFTIAEGPQVFVDHVLVVGNESTSAETVRREMVLKPGMPLGYADLAESQRRISAMGLFRRVRITELDHGSVNHRDLLVTVEEAPATTVGYGGGLEGGQRLRRAEPGGPAVEVFELAPRGFFEFGRRNLFGRNQSINLFARASLLSRASTTDVDVGEEPPAGYALRDYRALGTFRAPRVLGTPGDLVITGFLEQGLRSSFNFTRRGARVELARRVSPSLSVATRYIIERTTVFEERFDPADQPLIDRLFPQVRLSTASASLFHDTRDDALGPTRGALLGVDGIVALRAIGSEVGFVKAFAQGFVYRRLPGSRGLVVALGGRLGLANGFERPVPQQDGNGDPGTGPGGEPPAEVVDELPASERFFAGGDTSVRGFALDRLGTPDTIDRNGFPKGGNAVIVLNAELRIPVWRDLGAVGFLDAGNVFNRVGDFSMTEIRPTSGLGVRYRSPIGPLRVDLGFKLDRRMLPTGVPEPRTELHISLGQAF